MNDFPTAPEDSAFGAFFASLLELDIGYAGATGKGGQFHCPNPDHDDENASFDVIVGRNGKPVFACAPCDLSLGREEFARVLRTEGVRWSGDPVRAEEVDWGAIPAPSYSRGANGQFVQGKASVVYTYKFTDGSPNFKVYRYDFEVEGKKRKSFRPARYVLGSGYVTGLEGVERTPYMLDRFEDWAERFDVIYLVEGEKAARAVLAQKRPATTFHGGTNSGLEDEWVDLYGFGRFKEVRVWPDADEAGVLWARARVEELQAAGVNASTWGVPATSVEAKDDAHDVLARGHKPIRLTDRHLDALAALKPVPVARQDRAVEPRSVVVGGMTLVSAAGAPAGSGGSKGKAGGRTPREMPYSTAVGVEPYVFTEELTNRWFRLGEGDAETPLTLRFHLDRSFWRWEEAESRYVIRADEEVRAMVARVLAGAEETVPDGGEVRPVKVKARTVGEVVECLRYLTLVSPEGGGALLPVVGGVPFRNGWLNARTGELEPIGPERDVRWNVPLDYTEDAGEPSAWFAFLDSIGFTSKTDERRLLRQWFGYLLSGSKAQQKAMLLLGPKRAGKGTILEVAHAMLGDGAAGTTLDSLTGEFGLQNLIGKGLATIGDARFGFKTEPKVVERILSLTGDDAMPVNVKFGKPLSLRLGARLMIATNELPKFIEASDALASRFVILKFSRSFYGSEDLGLKERVLSDLAGIVRWALDGLRDLNGLGSFVDTKAGQELQQQMIRDAAPVRLFVEEECELDPSAFVAHDDLYIEYRLWAEKNGIFILDKPRFGRDINTAYDGVVREAQKRIGGKRVRGRYGLRLR